MTIEGRPTLDYDWEKQYENQRASRLADAVNEYMDEEVSLDVFYRDLTVAITETIEHHSTSLNKAQRMLNMINAVPPVPTNVILSDEC